MFPPAPHAKERPPDGGLSFSMWNMLPFFISLRESVPYGHLRPPAGSPLGYVIPRLGAFFVELEGVEPSSNGETGNGTNLH